MLPSIVINAVLPISFLSITLQKYVIEVATIAAPGSIIILILLKHLYFL